MIGKLPTVMDDPDAAASIAAADRRDLFEEANWLFWDYIDCLDRGSDGDNEWQRLVAKFDEIGRPPPPKPVADPSTSG